MSYDIMFVSCETTTTNAQYLTSVTGGEYRRNGEFVWEMLYGNSWEPEYHLDRVLEESYRKYLETE